MRKQTEVNREADPLFLSDPPSYGLGGPGDPEKGPQALSLLTANVVRLGFIRKVYSLLTAQIVCTILVALPFFLIPDISDFVIANPAIFYVVLGVSLVFVLILTCCPHTARTSPGNYLLLFGFTICEGLLVGVITAQHNTESVLIAAGMTAGITLILTIYAFNTKADFTGYGIYLLVALFALIGLGFIAIITGSSAVAFLYNCIGVLLFCFYIVYDTQLIVGGKHHEFKFTVDDYILATLCIYLDIINLFLHLLSLLDSK